MSTLQDVYAHLNAATLVLRSAPPCQNLGSPEKPRLSCIEKERRRTPARAERLRCGGPRLPIQHYNVHGMCGPCRAYWYAVNAETEVANLLHSLAREAS